MQRRLLPPASGRSRRPSTSPTTSCSSSASRCTPTTRGRITGGIGVRRARAGRDAAHPRRRRAPRSTRTTCSSSTTSGADRPRRRHGRRVHRDRRGRLRSTCCWRPRTGPARRSPAPPRRHSCRARRRGASSAVVDPQLPPVAAERAARLLVEHGGGTIAAGRTDAGAAPAPAPGAHAAGAARPRRRRDLRRGATVRRLQQVGCRVEFDTGTDGHGVVVATPPSWRPDLVQPADLVEEVLRLEGYDTIPSVLPPAPPGRGLTAAQLRRRAVSRRWPRPAASRCCRSRSSGAAVWDAFGLPADDVRRRTVPRGQPAGRRPARARHHAAARACSTRWCATGPAGSPT